MKESKLKYPIYDLTPEKFTRLCEEILSAEYNFDKLIIPEKEQISNADIVGYKGIESYSIQITHKYKISDRSLVVLLKLNKISQLNFNKRILITSAFIDENILTKYESNDSIIINQKKLFILLDKYEDISNRYFSIVNRKKTNRRYWIAISTVGILVSLLSIGNMIFENKYKEEKSLTDRIENVEQTLEGIKGLEKDLEGIKEDMIKTDLENKKIIEEYEKIKGLEDLMMEKKEAMKLVFDYQPWYKTIAHYAYGLLSGIFCSIIGSILRDRYKLNKSLKEEI